MPRPNPLPALLCLALLACQDTDEQSPLVAVRDSAGIAIVETAGDPWSAEDRWHTSAEPVVRIGAVEGEAPYLFDGILGVGVLSDGRIVVANSGDKTLRWFDADGRFLFQRGGSGEGPGEFSGLGGITVATGDTVVAVDASLRRFTLFGPDGELGPTRRITGLMAPPGRMYRLSDGGWVVGTDGFGVAQFGGNVQSGVHRLDSPILRVSSDGARLDTIGVFPSIEIDVRVTGNGASFRPARFGRNLSYGVLNDRIFVGTADRLAVDVYSPTGRHVRSVRAPEVDVRLTAEVEAAYRESVRERLARLAPERRAAAERVFSGGELPPTIPAYSSLLVDEQGNVWLGEFRADYEPPRRFLIFDRDGRFVTGIAVPPDFRVMTIARGQVWGRATDELEVQYVVGYSIVRESK